MTNNTNLFVHLSREKILLMGNWFSKELPYFDIERKLPLLLIDTIQEYGIDSICVYNWPWSFTTLRLGCLIINTIEKYAEKDIVLYSIGKQKLLAQAYKDWLLPSIWYVFIGQKKNMWEVKKLVDEELERSTRIVSVQDMEQLPEKYFIDACDHMLLEYLEESNMVDIHGDGSHIFVSYKDQKRPYDIFTIAKKVDELEPNYCMEPQIG